MNYFDWYEDWHKEICGNCNVSIKVEVSKVDISLICYYISLIPEWRDMVISIADYRDSVRHLIDMGADFGDINRNDVFTQALIDGKIIKFKNHKPERMYYLSFERLLNGINLAIKKTIEESFCIQKHLCNNCRWFEFDSNTAKWHISILNFEIVDMIMQCVFYGKITE